MYDIYNSSSNLHGEAEFNIYPTKIFILNVDIVLNKSALPWI